MENQIINDQISSVHSQAREVLFGLKQEIQKIIIGNEETITFILIALLCNGHVLLEGVPGVAKTTLIKVLTQVLGLTFKRIQFTPDLLPADLVGTLIFNPKTNDFEIKQGPIFANLILADEINRAPAKVQSALLEAMQEQQVTIGSTSLCLDKPFLVLATQNPIEQEGTYRLPEAQIDRFMFKLLISYASPQQEKAIIRTALKPQRINTVLSKEQLFALQNTAQGVYVDEKIMDYIVNIIFATRAPEKYGLASINHYLQHGVSPRASLSLYQAIQAMALLEGRHFVTPDDVKKIVFPVLRHRITLTFEAEAEHITADQIISSIIKTVPCP